MFWSSSWDQLGSRPSEDEDFLDQEWDGDDDSEDVSFWGVPEDEVGENVDVLRGPVR